MTSASFITFMERSAIHDAFQQEYDPGMMYWNNACDGSVWWPNPVDWQPTDAPARHSFVGSLMPISCISTCMSSQTWRFALGLRSRYAG